jgi:hypothetical protein
MVLEKITARVWKNIYHAEEVMSQVSSTKFKICCNLVTFSMNIVGCSAHVDTTFDPTPRVHKHNLGTFAAFGVSL